MSARPVVLVNSAGVPEPSPEVQRRLRQVHPELGLRFVPDATDRVWMVTLNWGPNDPRHEMVKRGELAPNAAWDIVGYLPLDCRPDDAPAYLERSLRQHSKEDVRALASHVVRYNDTVGRQQVDTAVNDAFTVPFEASRITGRRTRHL